jgi:hypothetical protein
MKRLRLWLLERREDGLLAWDQLRSVGNSRIVQASVLFPILGYLILFNDQALSLLAMAGLDRAPHERLLRGRPDGIFVNPFETGAIGPDLFRAACDMGLEGIVSKRGTSRYRGGRSKDWIKVKNRHSPAMNREIEWQ